MLDRFETMKVSGERKYKSVSKMEYILTGCYEPCLEDSPNSHAVIGRAFFRWQDLAWVMLD